MCVALLASMAAGCSPASDDRRATVCSSKRALIAFIDAEWEKKWQRVPRQRTSEPGQDCIAWSGDPPAMDAWINEITRSYYAGLTAPNGAVTGTAEENAGLKQALAAADIAYSARVVDEKEWIYWDERDDAKARVVMKRVWGTDLTPQSAADKAALAEAQKSWPVDERRASQIVLDAYPGISSNARVDAAVATFRSRPLPGFADAGPYAWIVMIVCDSGRMHARFFVHPISGKVVVDVQPGGKGSVQCA